MDSRVWLDNTFLSLVTSAPGNTFTLPVTPQADCAGFLNAALMAYIDSFSGGGSVALDLQTGVTESSDDNAWTTLVTATITTTGPQVLWIGDAAATPPLGKLRLKATCTVAATSFTLRVELLQKHVREFQLSEWVPAQLVNFAGSGTQYMPADQWADCSRYLLVAILCEWITSSGAGSNLTVKLQTAPYSTGDANMWADCASSTMASSSSTIIASAFAAVPPMGVVRLAYTAAAALSGTLRVVLLLKGT